MKHPIILLLSLLSASTLFSQIRRDTAAENQVKKLEDFYTFNQQDFILDSIQFEKIDTTFEWFYYYNPQLHNFKTNLGNNGSAQKDLTYSSNHTLGFKTQFDFLDDFRVNWQNNVYHDLSQPYAKVFYVNGSQREENIDIRFSQNIAPRWNMGVEYKKVGSEGFYQHQRNNINNFRAYQSYKTKNNAYGILLNFNYNDTYNEENWGITYDSSFTDFPEVSRKGIEIVSDDSKNTSRNQELFAKHYLNIGSVKKILYRDENDSLYPDSVIGKWVTPTLTFYHQFRYYNQEFGYEETLVDSLSQIKYNDTTIRLGFPINESTLMREYDNEAGVRYMAFRSMNPWMSSLGLDAFAGYQWLNYQQNENHFGTQLRYEDLTNTYIGASINNALTEKHHLNIKYKTVIDGYDEGESQLLIQSNNRIGKMRLFGQVNIEEINPTLIQRSYSSSTASWENPLNKIQQNKFLVRFGVPHLNFSLDASYNQMTNYTYFDSNAVVTQYQDGLNVLRLSVLQKFKVWKLHLDLKAQYQNVNEEGVINLPEFMTYSSFYIEDALFNREMKYRLGADLYWASNYYGDDYAPNIRQYITQNAVEIESYPWMEVFLMLNVDRLYFFAKLTNILEGAVPYNYFAAPGYPMPDRAFKFGLKWQLIN